MADEKPQHNEEILVDEPENGRAKRYKKLFGEDVAKLRKDQGSIKVNLGPPSSFQRTQPNSKS